MRAKTLAAAEVVGLLNSRFVIAWSNLLPELYGAAVHNPNRLPTYEERRIELLPEGAGGGNIRLYFCRPDGSVVHQVVGYWRPDRLLDELAFAEGLLALGHDAVAHAHKQRTAMIETRAESAAASVPERLVKNDPAARRAAQWSLRRRSAHEVQQLLGKDVDEVLRQRRIRVYTEGAIGCDS